LCAKVSEANTRRGPLLQSKSDQSDNFCFAKISANSTFARVTQLKQKT